MWRPLLNHSANIVTLSPLPSSSFILAFHSLCSGVKSIGKENSMERLNNYVFCRIRAG